MAHVLGAAHCIEIDHRYAGGFQPAAVKLAFFIETNCGKIKNFRDAAAELPALYGILSRASKEGEFYQMKRGEALAKRGDSKGAIETLRPLAEKLRAEIFTAKQNPPPLSRTHTARDWEPKPTPPRQNFCKAKSEA